MKIDKKSKEGILHLVLLKNIGEAFLTSEYSDELLKETIESFL
jgi:3-dehydroquinate synthetase